MSRRKVSSLLAAILVAGCSAKKSKPECGAPDGCAAVLTNIDTGEAHVELISDDAGGAYAALRGSGSSETCVNGQICHGQLLRLGDDGSVLWSIHAGYAVDAPFVLEDGGVVWRGDDGGLHCANGDGSMRWDLPVGDKLVVASADADSVVAVAGGNAMRIDATTGQVAWTQSFAPGSPVDPVALPDASAVFAGYTGTNGEFVRMSYQDGSSLFDVQISSTLSAPVTLPRWPYGPFMLAADRLSLRDWKGRESWGLDSVEGWRFVVAMSDGYIADGPYEQRVTRVRSDGTILWSIPIAAPVVWLAAAPDGGILVGRNDGTLDKLNAGTGLLLWEYGGIAGVEAPTPPRFSAKGNVVFAGANVGANSDTHLTTASPAGQQLERWNAGTRIESFVITDRDDVWLATTAGKLYLRRGASL